MPNENNTSIALHYYLKENGKEIVFNSNKIQSFNDPSKCWYIKQGVLNVIASKYNNDFIGKRFYLTSFIQGELIFGFKDIGRNGFGLFIEPEPDSIIYEINTNDLLTGNKKNASELIETYTNKIFNSIINVDRNYMDKEVQYLSPSTKNIFEKEENLISTEHNFIWCKPQRNIDLIYLEQFPFEYKKLNYLPLNKNTFYKIYGKSTIEAFTSYELINNSELIKALQYFNELILLKLFFEIKQQKILNEEWLEKKYKSRNKEFFQAIHLAKNVLDESDDGLNIQKHKKSSNNFFNACSLVAEHSGIELTLPPDLEKSLNPINEISRYSGIRYREILLEGEWYKSMGNTPIIAFDETTEDPVAIIPKKKKVFAYNVKDGSVFKVDKNNFKRISKLSYILFKPLPNKKIGLKDILKYALFNNKKDIYRLLQAVFLVTVLSFMVPLMTAVLFDYIIPNAQKSQLIYIAIALFVAGVGGIAFEIVKSISLLRLRGSIDGSLQAAIWDRLLEMPADFFRKYTAGDLADRSLGVTNIIGILSGVVLTSLISGVFSVFNFILLYYFSPKLALIVTLFILVYLAMIYLLGKKQVFLEKKIQYQEGKNFGIILQLLTGITTLKVSGTEIKAFLYWFKNYIISKEYSINSQKIKNIQEVVRASFYLAVITMIYFAFIQFNTSISTGQFLAFSAALGSFIMSIISLSEGLVYAFETVPIYERIKPILEELPESYGVKSAPKTLEGNIELNNVSFKYDDNSPLIINNISFKINKGEYVALVGPSGSGKSTLIRLMLGFNQVSAGTIIYDNQEINNIDLKLLRRQIGVVLQDGSVLGDDIFTNIIGSSPSLTLTDAWDAAKAAAFDEDIESMPMGMFTIVSEDGGTLSGGQRQRLMIARALVHKPKILIFDEATSALDNRTQAIVTQSLDKLKVTRIVVAHRLSTIKKAGRIIYLENGKILEEGNYNDLMALKKKFYQLALRQLE